MKTKPLNILSKWNCRETFLTIKHNFFQLWSSLTLFPSCFPSHSLSPEVAAEPWITNFSEEIVLKSVHLSECILSGMFINNSAWEKFLTCLKKLISYASKQIVSCSAVRFWVKSTQWIAEMTALYIKDVWAILLSIFFMEYKFYYIPFSLFLLYKSHM